MGMEPLERKVADFIRDNDLFTGTGQILLAVSGGADSIALLHVMHRLAQRGVIAAELLCAHLHHGLRGAAADGDEGFVIRQARELGLPVVIRAIDVKAHAHEHQLSIETAARQQRLNCLAQIARECNCPSVALGHQKNDNAETVLHRLERGTGFRGLAGIHPMRRAGENLTFVRPLLSCSHAEIVEYLQSRDLTWREDHTNLDCIHTRNRIRHRLLPALQAQSCGSLVEELTALAASAGRLHHQVATEAAKAAAKHAVFGPDHVAIRATALSGLPRPVAAELLRQLLTTLDLGERDLTRRHYEDLLGLAQSSPVKRRLSLPGGFSAHRNSTTVVLRKPTPRNEGLPGPVELRIPGTTQFGPYRIDAHLHDAAQLDRAAIASNGSPFQEYFDFNRIHLPVVVRARRDGDRFVPLGQHSDKKLGKFITAAKVPARLRLQPAIIEDSEKILWVCPIRISEAVKVTEKTSILLELKATVM
jgi:tRNA(Ile)-lysidine synthase